MIKLRCINRYANRTCAVVRSARAQHPSSGRSGWAHGFSKTTADGRRGRRRAGPEPPIGGSS